MEQLLMEQLPATISFEHTNKNAQTMIDNMYSDEIKKAREYLEKQCDKYQESASGYFYLDLRKTSAPVRQIIMEQVCTRFNLVMHTTKRTLVPIYDYDYYSPKLDCLIGDLNQLALFTNETSTDQLNIHTLSTIYNGKDSDRSERLAHYHYGTNDQQCYIVALTQDFIDMKICIGRQNKRFYICPKDC